MDDLQERQPSISETPHPLPGQSRALAATPKRHQPEPHRLRPEGVERSLIARHAVVIGVPTQDAGKPDALLRNGLIATPQKLAPKGMQLGPRPLGISDPLQRKAPGPAPPANMREAQEPERLRLTESPLLALLNGEPSKSNQPRLLGVQLQRELRQPATKIRPEPLRVIPMLKPHHKVSRQGESHPLALAEPGVNLSAHRAPIVQPSGRTPNRQ